MEAFRGATLAAQLHLQQSTVESAAQQARWQETINNEKRHRAQRPWATTNALVALSREADIGFSKPADVTLLQTPARSFQAAVVLADKLHATPGDLNITASLRRVLRNTVELQENISNSRQRLTGSDNVLSAAGHPSKDNRQASVPRMEAPPMGEAGNLRQAISTVAGWNMVPLSPWALPMHDRLGHQPDLRAIEMECYDNN